METLVSVKRSEGERVRLREELSGRISVSSNLPQYLMRAMLGEVRKTAFFLNWGEDFGSIFALINDYLFLNFVVIIM